MASLGHPCKFKRVSRLGSVTAQHFTSGRQPNCAALNRGRHLYSAGRPSRWALAHILFFYIHRQIIYIYIYYKQKWTQYTTYHQQQFSDKSANITVKRRSAALTAPSIDDATAAARGLVHHFRLYTGLPLTPLPSISGYICTLGQLLPDVHNARVDGP